MTILEYVLSHYLGEPTRTEQPGESYWPCPHCDHEKFHTMPDKPPFKHRTKCWKCDFGGDVYDMLWEFHPDENFGDRKARLAEFQREYERLGFIAEERGEPAPSAASTDKESMALAQVISAVLVAIDAGAIGGAVFEDFSVGDKNDAKSRTTKKTKRSKT